MYLKATGCEGLDWVSMTTDGKLWRIFVITAMNFQVP